MPKPLHMFVSLMLSLTVLSLASACQNPGCIRHSECKRGYMCTRSRCRAPDGGVVAAPCSGVACALDAGKIDNGAPCTGLACAIDAGTNLGSAGEMSAAGESGTNTETGAAGDDGTAAVSGGVEETGAAGE